MLASTCTNMTQNLSSFSPKEKQQRKTRDNMEQRTARNKNPRAVSVLWMMLSRLCEFFDVCFADAATSQARAHTHYICDFCSHFVRCSSDLLLLRVLSSVSFCRVWSVCFLLCSLSHLSNAWHGRPAGGARTESETCINTIKKLSCVVLVCLLKKSKKERDT